MGERALDRASVIAALREIGALLALQGASKFKARAFDRGARSLEASRVPLEQLLEEKRLGDLPGIGPALVHQIEELSATGRSALLDSLRAGLPSGVLELAQVSGIGLHALKSLHEELGIATLADLKVAAETGKLRTARGFGEKREARVLTAIERYETTAPTITLPRGLEIAESFAGEIAAVPGVESVHLAGSLRRFHELSTELAFVVGTSDDADEEPRILDALASLPRVGSVERRDGRGCRLRLSDGTRVEIALARVAELPTALVRGTAVPEHWADLVARAAARGLRLEPSGLYDDANRRVALEDDGALYPLLGLSVVPVEMRTGEGEIALAARADPFDLVESSDLRGFVHCHTTWSDGKASIEEMARAAEELGAAFITITDHSQSAHYARGLDVDRLARQWDEIAEAQENVGIRILRGTEADILEDGALDWPDAILEKLDVVIASIHGRHRQDEAAMTARVLRAMQHPIFKIWGHPLGRLVPSRPPIPLRVEEALDALAASRGAIEISGDPARLDLEPRWVRPARERGIPFVLSVDAHSIRALVNVKFAVGLARRAGVRKGEVLNARSADAFSRAVRPC